MVLLVIPIILGVAIQQIGSAKTTAAWEGLVGYVLLMVLVVPVVLLVVQGNVLMERVQHVRLVVIHAY
jgi:ACR3 family arsenite efflux pump ArsB